MVFSLYGINGFVFVTKSRRIVCKAETEFLYVIETEAAEQFLGSILLQKWGSGIVAELQFNFERAKFIAKPALQKLPPTS
jgi:hypothetical protein